MFLKFIFGHTVPLLFKYMFCIFYVLSYAHVFQTVHEAQCLANQVQLFYAAQRHETFQQVETFNHRPAEFKHMAVIAELEQSGVGQTVTAK